MKIDAVRIHSFGKIHNKDEGPIDPGLTVVFGENESGKTTFKEFIRTTLFDLGRKRKGLYPQPSSTDAGEVDCITDAGEKFTIKRKGNSITSDNGVMPENLTGITAEMYQKVYAMNPEDLIDMELVASGDIKRRFLTIPGGDDMPRISEEINSELIDLLNDKKLTDTRGIGKIFDDIKRIDEKIEIAKANGPVYKELTDRETKMKSELAEMTAAQKRRQEILDRVNVHNTQTAVKSNIAGLTEERKKMNDADKAPTDGLDTYNELKNKADNTLERKNEADKTLESIKEQIGEVNCETLADNKDKIIRLNENIGTYKQSESKKDVAETESEKVNGRISKLIEEYRLTDDLIDNADTGPETVERAKAKMPKAEKKLAVPIIAMVLGVISVAAAFFADVTALYAVGLIAIAIGAVLVFVQNKTDKEDDFPEFIATKGFPKNTSKNDAIRLCPAIDEVRHLKNVKDAHAEEAFRQSEIIQELNSELKNVLNAVGWTPTSYDEDVRKLRTVSESVPKLIEAEKIVKETSENYLRAYSELNEYLTPYGSEEELKRIVSMKAERNKLDVKLNAFNEALKNSGVDLDEELPEIPEDLENEIGGLRTEIGKVQNEKSKILKDADTESLYTEKSSLEAELDEQIRRWGVLSLEQTIVDRACDEIYEDMQPAVIQTADRYLDMMTCGEYRMDSDPRTRDVAVKSSTEVKTGDQWSSGLAGQVGLSLKLAVAKELSKETLPIILDDVLLFFDSERKKGACKALAEVAEEMQIMLFTCDRETYDFMTEIGAKTIIMHR